MLSHSLTIGLVQFDISWENPELNINKVEQLLEPHSGLDLVLLPEMWSTGFSMHPETAAESVQGPALQWMMAFAREKNMAIAGSLAVKEGIKFYNRWYCTFPDGQMVQYDKKHLFSYGKEDLHYTPGIERITFEIKGWNIMPLVCYDLRFPVWCRNTLSYDLMLVAANWPKPRIHHWDCLLKARAIENQCFVAAVNRIGRDGNDLEYPGHSSIYDMNGLLIQSLDNVEGVSTLVLDKESLLSYRDQFRFLQDRDDFTL